MYDYHSGSETLYNTYFQKDLNGYSDPFSGEARPFRYTFVTASGFVFKKIIDCFFIIQS